MVTASDATIRKWTKWITARESVVKVRYISTNQETHAFVSINPAIGQSTTGLCRRTKKCRDGHGGLGKMYAMGSRVYKPNPILVQCICRYSCFQVLCQHYMMWACLVFLPRYAPCKPVSDCMVCQPLNVWRNASGSTTSEFLVSPVRVSAFQTFRSLSTAPVTYPTLHTTT
jgi:hypothetical protein